MNIPDKSDQVDLHFTSLITNLEYKITQIEQNMLKENEVLKDDIIKLRNDVETGEYIKYQIEAIDQMRIDYNELRDIIDTKDDELINSNTSLIETKLNKFKKEINQFLSEKTLTINSLKSDINGMATVNQVTEKFTIIDKELKT